MSIVRAGSGKARDFLELPKSLANAPEVGAAISLYPPADPPAKKRILRLTWRTRERVVHVHSSRANTCERLHADPGRDAGGRAVASRRGRECNEIALPGDFETCVERRGSVRGGCGMFNVRGETWFGGRRSLCALWV